MDPASATSLAAAILQLADFTRKVLSRSQELYKSVDGALIRHTELSVVASNFVALLDHLKIKNSTTQLGALAAEAQDVTQELLDLLHWLKDKADPNHRWASVRHAILTLMKDSQLHGLEQRVDRYRKQTDSALLHDLQ
jgi:hypothetical protein